MVDRAIQFSLPVILVTYSAVQSWINPSADYSEAPEIPGTFKSEPRRPLILISTGLVRGIIGTSRDGNTFYQFLGIPYAQPPIGDLRFETPLPPRRWNGTRVTDRHLNPCLQINFITGLITGSEDCLYLNVFVPKPRPSGNASTDNKDLLLHNGLGHSTLLPVMIFIYGGYFMYGAAHHYGPTYFMDEEIILVTFDYRVGALGFLNTADGVVRGNMGLKDQNMVMRWVQENIVHFGGDPNRVTLFGESAGASSVHFHILSPMSSGLFHKAISQSGTAIRTWQIVHNPGDQARRLGKQLQCPTHNTLEMVACLKTKDASELVDAFVHRIVKLRVFQDLLSSPLAQYAPSVEYLTDENTFLDRPPMEILKSGNFSHVPWMCGVNSEEGLVYSARVARNRNVIYRISNDWKNVAPILLNYDENLWEVADHVKKFYFPRRFFFKSISTNFNRHSKHFTDMFSDRLYFTAAHVSIREHAKHAPVYAFYFAYSGEFTFYNLFQSSGKYPRIVELGYTVASNWIKETIFRRRRARFGVCHGDELPMFFSLNLLSTIRRKEVDYPMSRDLTAAWVRFAHDHTQLHFRNQTWFSVDPNDKSPNYMLLNNTNSGLVREPFTARAKFWEGLGLID